MSQQLRILLVGLTVTLVNTISSLAIDIDFEGYDQDTTITEITTQYCFTHGAIFYIVDNPNASPIIAVQDCPRRAYDGGGVCPGLQHDRPTDGIASLTDPLVGGMGSPNYAIGQSIGIAFYPPINSIRLHVIDIDGQDTVTVRAWSDNSVVAAVTKSGGDPGTGNTVSTPFELTGDFITRVEVIVPPVIGYAIDAISFTRLICPEGDMNGDCQIDVSDVEPFVNALVGVNTDCAHVAAADLDESGAADGQDIGPFVDAILQP